MRHLVISICLSCAVIAALAAWGWQRWLHTELSPSEYGALYALKRMAPGPFAEKMQPALEKALEDKRLTHGELRDIERNLSDAGQLFSQALTERSLDEQLSKRMQDIEEKTKEAGRNLGDMLGKVLDEALDSMLRKSQELTKPKPKPDAPSTF